MKKYQIVIFTVQSFFHFVFLTEKLNIMSIENTIHENICYEFYYHSKRMKKKVRKKWKKNIWTN